MAREDIKSVTTLPIDATGELAHYGITGDDRCLVAVHLDGTEAASYRIEFGVYDDTETPQWFTADDSYTYSSTATISDSWMQCEQLMRIVVTSAASSGATADVYVSRGD